MEAVHREETEWHQLHGEKRLVLSADSVETLLRFSTCAHRTPNSNVTSALRAVENYGDG